MSNEKLEEAIAKAIFMGEIEEPSDAAKEVAWSDSSAWRREKRFGREVAETVMACPELIAALAPPAPHIVGVDGYEALPEGSVFLDSRNGVHVIRDKSLGHTDAVRAILRDLAPFTVLHVGGAV